MLALILPLFYTAVGLQAALGLLHQSIHQLEATVSLYQVAGAGSKSLCIDADPVTAGSPLPGFTIPDVGTAMGTAASVVSS